MRSPHLAAIGTTISLTSLAQAASPHGGTHNCLNITGEDPSIPENTKSCASLCWYYHSSSSWLAYIDSNMFSYRLIDFKKKLQHESRSFYKDSHSNPPFGARSFVLYVSQVTSVWWCICTVHDRFRGPPLGRILLGPAYPQPAMSFRFWDCPLSLKLSKPPSPLARTLQLPCHKPKRDIFNGA